MHSLDIESAEAIARQRVDQLAKAVGDRFEILSSRTQVVDAGWVFFFNTSDFVRTGDIASALAGNGPIFVSRDGSIHELPSAIPWEEALLQIKSMRYRSS